MTLHIIIDGYNVLGSRGWSGQTSSQDLETCRERLLQELTRYHHRKGHHLTVVFDAWRDPHPEHREHRSGVQVIYTQAGERADQVIQRMVRQLGKDCVVVSSDLEIKVTAQSHGALTMSAQEFQGKLHAVVQGGNATGRSIGHAAFEKEDDDFDAKRPDKKGNPRKLPKAQRQRSRQLKGF